MDTTSYIKRSVGNMRSLLIDADNNVPKDEEFPPWQPILKEYAMSVEKDLTPGNSSAM